MSNTHSHNESPDRKLIRISAMNDQVWASLESQYDQIHGPIEDETQPRLVRQMAAAICGEIQFRGAKANAGV